MTLKEALQSLDHEDDSLWTADGLPRLDNLREVTGQPLLSREDIEAEFSGFRRGLTLDADEVEPEVEESSVEVEAEEEEVEDDVQIEPSEELEALEKEIAYMTEVMEELYAEGKQIKDALIEARARKTALEQRRLDLLPSDTPQDAIKAYLSRQKEIALERAKQRQALATILPPSASPLDEALKRRR